MALHQQKLKSIKSVNGEVTSLSFHPNKDIFAYGSVEGNLIICSYTLNSDPHELRSFNYHKKSCRALSFYSDGSHFISASADRSFALIDLDCGLLVHRFIRAHESAIYSALVLNRNIISTGDDDGCIKLWDTRHKKCIMNFKEHDDCITDMITDDKFNLLMCTSGDGTLSAYDVRKHKKKMQSENMNAGLLSAAIVKNGEKVVCGGEDGVLNFFNWNEWGNISDRYPGHPMSIEKIVPLTPHVICTAASDAIRAVHLFPNEIIDIIGDHGGSPIECLSLSHCKTWLASCSHDEHIRFWNVSDVMVNGRKKNNVKHFNFKNKKSKFVTKSDRSKRENFFADLVEDITKSSNHEDTKSNENSDDSDSDDCDSDNESEDFGSSENQDALTNTNNKDKENSNKSKNILKPQKKKLKQSS